MDVKHLEQVDDDGLELWNPVMKSPLPISAADARVVLTALRVSAPLDRDTYDLPEPGEGCGLRPARLLFESPAPRVIALMGWRAAPVGV